MKSPDLGTNKNKEDAGNQMEREKGGRAGKFFYREGSNNFHRLLALKLKLTIQYFCSIFFAVAPKKPHDGNSQFEQGFRLLLFGKAGKER